MSARRGASEPADLTLGLKRIAVLAALAFVTLLMLRDGLTYVLRPIDPVLALRIDPANAEVAASRAEQMLRENPAMAPQAEALARRALRRSPVSAAGARMLATTRDLARDETVARHLMVYSESLSQRDLPTQLWLIEDAVQHNDIPRALHHYDIALRSSEAAQPLLIPVLVQAIAHPAVVGGLVDTLATRPVWADTLLGHASVESRDFDGLARLLTGLARRGYPVPPAVAAQASGRMIDARRYDLAWAVYAATRPGVRRADLRDLDLASTPDTQGPFGWSLLNGNGLFAELRRYGARNAIAYTAVTGAGGVIARQLVMLPAGQFRLEGHSFEHGPDSPWPQVRVTCVGSAAPAGSVAAAPAAFSTLLTIPAGCPAQWVELFVEGGDNPLGASGALGALRIVDPGTEGKRP